MMGVQEAPALLFYDFDLEAHVPSDHILREIDRFLDVSTIHQQLAPHYSHLGRPSIDPELIIRMLVVGYVLGIRSERRLCDEVHLNLAYRWFCRLGLNSKVPDHSTFSKYRHGKFRDSDLLRSVFEATVARCISEGLVGGHGFAVDASLIEADVDRMNSTAQSEWDVSAINPDDAPRAVREYLDVLDDKAFGASTPVKPKFTSHSDPASQWTPARKGPAIFCYSNNYLIDTDHSVIVDVEATRSIRQAEMGAAQTMIDRTEKRFSIKPDWQVADTAYGSAENLAWLTKTRSIIPFIPLIDKSERTDGTFSRSDFEWDEDNDRYTCPEGQHLLQSRRNYSDPHRYRATKAICDASPSKSKCCPNTNTRFIGREEYEDARDFARLAAKSPFNPKAQAKRKKVEMLFAHLKRILGLGRLRLRGPCGVHDEFTLAAIAQNLRKLAKLRPKTTETRITI